ncbi:HD domain-containing phosphohydrolase [Neobacillus sp. PS3-40]|uniref:HD-GYP domain-containing protein n=1 Tax=Neobacillus sp. PS3-40 TaxID=3070679 RepID=UPI0027E05E35|nr:HD domain-containing phosphohydrolase [Neobacillus sp. PS3-40]WML45772.1 HD domain-containing protein [Neobacillus sp. PS3-40]
MQLIEISKYDHETMQLARPIYDRMRRVLLASGRTIHPKLINRIQSMGISTLMVEDAESIGITMDEMVDMPTWMDMIDVVQKAYQLAEKKKTINIIELQKAVVKIIHEVTKRKTIFLIPSSSVADELKNYAHSVNVTLLTIQTAKKLHYTNSQLRDLALGSMLHDIGKVVSNEQKEHPQKGFELIKAQREISLLSAHIAYQHHEQLNGKGYPRGLSGDELLEFPQICAIANIYERLISNGTYLPHEALEFIMTKHEIEYKGKVVEAFLNSVPSYIPGTKVMLSNDKRAIVIGIKSHLHRPVVRFLHNSEEIDLAESPSILIKEILV